MRDYIQSLPDGWTIYLWFVFGAGIIIAAVFFMYWAHKNDQFDEDIKYLVFDDDDEDKMSVEDFAKYKEVLKDQQEKRQVYLKKIAEERK